MVITTTQIDSIKPEISFSAGSNPAQDISKVCGDEDL